MNLRANNTLCQTYVNDMANMGVKIALLAAEPIPGSTDMGNVSHYVPSFHSGFVIPDSHDTVIHNPGFTAVAGSDRGHEAAIKSAKGMAMLALRVLTDATIAKMAREDFGKPDDEDL